MILLKGHLEEVNSMELGNDTEDDLSILAVIQGKRMTASSKEMVSGSVSLFLLYKERSLTLFFFFSSFRIYVLIKETYGY